IPRPPERARRGIPPRGDAAHHQGGSVSPLAPPALLRGHDVFAARYRRRELLSAADELPASSYDLSGDAPFLSRVAAAAGRIRARLPLRSVGRIVGADARARLLHERRAYLLPLRPSEGRVPARDAAARLLLRSDGHQ